MSPILIGIIGIIILFILMASGMNVGIAMAVGCLLSLLGVLYPALVAARMQPVEAMRAE